MCIITFRAGLSNKPQKVSKSVKSTESNLYENSFLPLGKTRCIVIVMSVVCEHLLVNTITQLILSDLDETLQVFSLVNKEEAY